MSQNDNLISFKKESPYETAIPAENDEISLNNKLLQEKDSEKPDEILKINMLMP